MAQKKRAEIASAGLVWQPDQSRNGLTVDMEDAGLSLCLGFHYSVAPPTMGRKHLDTEEMEGMCSSLNLWTRTAA